MTITTKAPRGPGKSPSKGKLLLITSKCGELQNSSNNSTVEEPRTVEFDSSEESGEEVGVPIEEKDKGVIWAPSSQKEGF